jgi:hypothetical protein
VHILNLEQRLSTTATTPFPLSSSAAMSFCVLGAEAALLFAVACIIFMRQDVAQRA